MRETSLYSIYRPKNRSLYLMQFVFIHFTLNIVRYITF